MAGVHIQELCAQQAHKAGIRRGRQLLPGGAAKVQAKVYFDAVFCKRLSFQPGSLFLRLPLPFSARGLCRSQPFGRRLRFQRASPGIHHCHFAVLHSLH